MATPPPAARRDDGDDDAKPPTASTAVRIGRAVGGGAVPAAAIANRQEPEPLNGGDVRLFRSGVDACLAGRPQRSCSEARKAVFAPRRANFPIGTAECAPSDETEAHRP